MKNYIKLTEENYFKSLELGLIPMDWIKRQATAGSDIFNNPNKVITYDGKLLDFRNRYNVQDKYNEVFDVSELNIINYKSGLTNMSKYQNYNIEENMVSNINCIVKILNFVNKILDEAKYNAGYIKYDMHNKEYEELCDSYNNIKNLILKIRNSNA